MKIKTRADAIREFTADVLPDVRARYEADGVPDYPARSEAWNDWTDALCKDRQITSYQYETWSAPPCCVAPWERKRRKARTGSGDETAHIRAALA